MTSRRPSRFTQLTALLLSVATPVMPVGMALMPLARPLASEAMAPMSAEAMPAHGGMHHHDAPTSPADAYRCCDLCAIACGSTATLPPVASVPAIGWLPYEVLLPEAPARPTAPRSSLRLPFAQAPPALLS